MVRRLKREVETVRISRQDRRKTYLDSDAEYDGTSFDAWSRTRRIDGRRPW